MIVIIGGNGGFGSRPPQGSFPGGGNNSYAPSPAPQQYSGVGAPVVPNHNGGNSYTPPTDPRRN